MRVYQKSYSFIILFYIALLTAFYLIFVTLQIPYVGLTVEKTDQGEWHVSKVEDIGWAHRQGIEVGDTVLKIDQDDPSSHVSVKTFGVIEKIKVIKIAGQEGPVVYQMSKELSSELLVYHIVIPAIVFIALLTFSIFLYIKKREDPSAFILTLFFMAVGFSYLSAAGSARTDLMARLINGVSFLTIPVFFLHFLYRYFSGQEIHILSRKFLYSLYILNGLLFIMNATFMMSEWGSFYPLIRLSQLIVFSASMILCLYILIARYIRYQKTIHKPVLKMMILGITLAFFPFVILVALPQILWGKELVPGSVVAAALGFLPLVFVYLVTARRLFDIDFIIGRIRYYSILAFLPAVMMVLFFIYVVDKDFTGVKGLQTAFVVYLGTIVLFYMKEILDVRFRSRLFPERYNFQASLDRFSQELAKVMKVSDLEERLVTEVKEVLSVTSVSLLEIDQSSFQVRRGERSSIHEQGIHQLQKDMSGLSIGDLVDLDVGTVGTCLVIGQKSEKLYVLWLKEKTNRTYLNQDERIWLKTMARYVSLVYENLHFMEGLLVELERALEAKDMAAPWLLRLIFNLSEKERRHLAADLHDSALQDQLLWYRKLKMISTNQQIPVEIRKELNYITDGLLDVMHQIRETCNELRPPFLKEMGIVESLENLFRDTQLRTNYVIYFHAKRFQHQLQDEHALALYRIVQELLTNAAKHSNASQIEITLECEGQMIYLTYQDNGRGMQIQSITSSFQHMGLSGIKQRVRSLEGKVDFHSVPGKGMEVSISLPVTVSDREDEQVI